MVDVNALLAERAKTHGDYTEHAECTQFLKNYYRTWKNWDKLTPCQKETMDMIAHKQGRILTGNPNIQDHWDDISGYSTLVSQRLVTLPLQGFVPTGVGADVKGVYIHNPARREVEDNALHGLKGQA